MTSDDQPFVRHRPVLEPKPEAVPFVAKLDAVPLDKPSPVPVDRVVAVRRARAEHLCLWLGCSRALCRRARHCHGPGATCVFEQADVAAPLLG